MKHILIIISFMLCANLNAQSLADFENYSLSENTYIKDAGTEGSFSSGDILLPNKFTDLGTFSFWEGWVVSNVKDTLTAGFTNDGASFAASGVNGSDHYAVSYAPVNSIIKLSNQTRGKAKVTGLYICNSTYSALSMKEGDGFAKKFGGETGSDPDFFYLSIKKWLSGELSQDSILFYLADYRFDDNTLDYIIDEWTWLDLSSLGVVDSLQFELHSSDVGSFGINTPTYFCVDDITVDNISSTESSIIDTNVKAFPNPTSDYINITKGATGKYQIFDLNGRLVQNGELNNNRIDVSSLEQGMYHLNFVSKRRQNNIKFCKR